MLTPDFSTQIKPQICHSQLTVDDYNIDGRGDSLSQGRSPIIYKQSKRWLY